MMKISTILSRLALAALVAGAFAACTTEDTPGTTNIPTGLMARSVDANTIAVMWTRASGDVGADTLIVTDPGGAVKFSGATSTTANTMTATGLTTNTVYTISVKGGGGTSSSINWMTANRTDGLQIFEYSSSGQSGLQLNGADNKAHVVSVSNGNSGIIDFLLDDKQRSATITSASGLDFEGAQNFDDTWRNSLVDVNGRYVVGGLNNDYSASEFTSAYSGMTSTDYPIDEATDYGTRGSRVLLVKTKEGNFAKIEIVPDPTTGKLYTGTGANRHITVNVSYQPTVGRAYAGRPH
jgi:hypothetical protein